EKAYQKFEQDQQLHYMRRMLNPCMGIINKERPLYQVFTSPEVYSFVWSLSPDLRNDEVYKVMFQRYAPQLLEIPWARTGLIYPHTMGTPDSFKKDHHDYGKMIRTTFLQDAINHIDNNKVL